MNGTDIDQDVEARYDRILREQGGKVESLFQRIPDILSKRDTHQHKYIKLLHLVNEAAALVDLYTPCEKGCGHCCAMAVSVSEYEAKRIAAHIGKPYVQQPKYELPDLDKSMTVEEIQEIVSKTEDEHAKKWLRVPCVFRGEQMECTIYPVRPLACRTYHTIAASNEPCQLGMAGQRAKEVPAIDFRNFHMAHVMLTPIDHPVADIREWFPEGRGK